MRSSTVLDAHGSQFLTEDSGEFPRTHYNMDYSIFFLHREEFTGTSIGSVFTRKWRLRIEEQVRDT
jgi:hypothetical protein